MYSIAFPGITKLYSTHLRCGCISVGACGAYPEHENACAEISRDDANEHGARLADHLRHARVGGVHHAYGDVHAQSVHGHVRVHGSP